MWNCALIFTSDAALLVRAVFEERTLARDAEYADYMQQVRWRVLPGCF
jgi:protein-S-isoprenylcysteine O-methyltransferase Ste14